MVILCQILFIHIYWFGLIWFYGLSTILDHLMPNPFYRYISNIYGLVWFGFMEYQPLEVISYQILFIHMHKIYKIWFRLVSCHLNNCRLFDAKSYLYILNEYDLLAHFLLYFQMSLSSFFPTVKWFQIFLSNTNNSIYFKTFVCTHLNWHTYMICK